MEDIRFTDTEQQYFGNLFQFCSDPENTEKIPLLKACELFRYSKVSPDTIKQITDLCAGGTSNYLGRKQFYTALKLIAASQAGIPIHQPDLVNSVVDLPLPKFLLSNDDGTYSDSISDCKSSGLIELEDLNEMKSLSNDRLDSSSDGELNDGDTEKVKSPKSGRNSLEASSTASDSPTITNNVEENNWAASDNWLGLVSEEQRQLLGTEEESSDKHSSDDETDKELWVITSELREYYTSQFKHLQPDPTGLLAGSTAKLFFKKSKLPIRDLRKIWHLSDVTRDGALSLEEFNVAMHLVVLRRNNIPLPDTLPTSLVPSTPSRTIQPPAPPPRDEKSPEESSISSVHQIKKQWTKFVDSPTNSLSSPGPKPVNFDFNKSAVEQDPKIYHPVPLRVTPKAASNNFNSSENGCCRSPRRLDIENGNSENNSHAPKKNSSSNVLQENSDIRPIQRPQPRKPPPGPGAIPPPPQQLIEDSVSGPASLFSSVNNHMAPKKEPPPPPPPRPYKTHTRSSSLDLNKLGKSSILAAPPAVPPRMSPSSTSPKKLIGQQSEDDATSLTEQSPSFADFSHFPSGEEKEVDAEIEGIDGLRRMHGAFQIYMKQPRCESPPCPLMKQEEAEKLEEHKSVLTRMYRELSQELIQVQEERNALQLKLGNLLTKYQLNTNFSLDNPRTICTKNLKFDKIKSCVSQIKRRYEGNQTQ